MTGFDYIAIVLVGTPLAAFSILCTIFIIRGICNIIKTWNDPVKDDDDYDC